jgi:hypothetical protein
MQKMFVIHYYINKQILDSYLHTKSEKIWLLFTFVFDIHGLGAILWSTL